MATAASPAAAAPTNLQLAVVINGVATSIIASFVRLDDGRFAATSADLTELGIRTPAAAAADDLIGLDTLPTASYKYDEQHQEIAITIGDAQRIPRAYDVNRGDGPATLAPAAWGAVLNYNLYLAGDNPFGRPSGPVTGSLGLDGRMFSPFGTFSQSAYLHADPDGQIAATRLDSTYRYSDQQRLIVYQAGDLITGGLAWTRPIRIGGVEAKKNFALRPDLITVPLPDLAGTAAVPSTVDVYINNVKMFSEEVGPGPFTFSDFPVITGAGDARIVVRDAAGHETTRTVPFYSAPQLLAPGLTSFSLEAGFPRLAYGTASDGYRAWPVATASARRGISDWLTIEGHVEGDGGLVNAGAGAVAAVRRFGTVSGAISASQAGRAFGGQAYVAVESRFFGVSVNLSALHSFGAYNDLASHVAQLPGTGARPVRALDRITIGAPVPFDRKASVSASFLHGVDGGGSRSDIVSGSWSRTLGNGASVFATAFADFGTHPNDGVFVGYSQRLGGSVSASTSLSAGSGGTTTVNVDAVKPLGADVGSFGWRVQDSESAAGAYREASLAYRAPAARLQGSVSQSASALRGTLTVEGSVATIGGGVFFANRIDDAFAVVRVGVPDVPVLYDNRLVGLTNQQGMILVPSLRSYDRNKITIDPGDLPVDADIDTTRTIVAPADRGGVLVDFGVRIATSSALVVFRGADGGFLPVGSTGTSDAGEDFIVGYDGQSFFKNLKPQNRVDVQTPQGPCQAKFAYVPHPGEQVVIAPVVCAVPAPAA